MRLLLDTPAFIWWDDAPAKLSPVVLAALRGGENSLHLSLASVWELQIKVQLGKVQLPRTLGELLEMHEQRNGLILEPVTRGDILALSVLPPLHRDPFDRMLVAQARRGGFHLVSCDPEIARYDVDVFW